MSKKNFFNAHILSLVGWASKLKCNFLSNQLRLTLSSTTKSFSFDRRFKDAGCIGIYQVVLLKDNVKTIFAVRSPLAQETTLWDKFTVQF